MKKLQPNFEINRYGLHCRLIQETDAAFIVSLRTDATLSRFIHDTPPSVYKQKEWIRCYKERELKGEDYYFIYSINEKRVGVDRLYKIAEDKFTFGSWIFLRGLPFWIPIAGAIIGREIGFETLEKKEEHDVDGMHKQNSGVIDFSRQLGMNFTGERIDAKGTYITGILYREDFEKNKIRFINKFPIKQ